MSSTTKSAKQTTQDAQQQKKLAAVYDGLTDDLKAEIKLITGRVETLKERDVRDRHEIGKQLLAIMADTSGKYGADPKAALQTVMPLSKDGLRPMIVLAETFEEAEIDDLLKLKNPVTDERLTWSHFIALTRLKDPTRRADLAGRAVAGGWNSKELVKSVTAANGGRKSKGGRKAKRPTSVAATLEDISARVQTFVNTADAGWLAPGGLDDLYDVMANKPGWRPDQSLIAGITATLDHLNSLTAKVAVVVQKVSILKHRAEAARPAARAAA